MEGDAGVLTPIGEPTLSVTLEVKIDGLLLGDVAADPVGRDRADHRADPRRRHRAERAPTRRVPTRCAAASAGRAGAAARRGRLGADADRADARARPRRAVALDDRAEDGVLLFAEGVSLGRGRPGRSGAQARGQAVRRPANRRSAPTPTRSSAAPSSNARARISMQARESPESRAILRSIFVRVWAELGQDPPAARAGASSSRQGAVVELDQRAERAGRAVRQRAVLRQRQPRRHRRRRVGRAGRRAAAVARTRAPRRPRSTTSSVAAGPITGATLPRSRPSMTKSIPLSRAVATATAVLGACLLAFASPASAFTAALQGGRRKHAAGPQRASTAAQPTRPAPAARASCARSSAWRS